MPPVDTRTQGDAVALPWGYYALPLQGKAKVASRRAWFCRFRWRCSRHRTRCRPACRRRRRPVMRWARL